MSMAKSLLYNYYNAAWAQMLPMPQGWNAARALSEPTLAAFLAASMDPARQRGFAERLQDYRTLVAPRRRYEMIKSMLPKDWAEGVCVDIGAGDAALGTLMSAQLEPSGRFVSIDPLLRPFSFGAHIGCSEPPSDLRPHLAIFFFSLHHMTDHEIGHYFGWLKRVGCQDVIVVEDCVGLRVPLDPLTTAFCALDANAVRDVYALNEYVANVWTYGGPPHLAQARHITASDWARLFHRLGYVVNGSSSFGFDLTRLHGVPATAMRLFLRDHGLP